MAHGTATVYHSVVPFSSVKRGAPGQQLGTEVARQARGWVSVFRVRSGRGMAMDPAVPEDGSRRGSIPMHPTRDAPSRGGRLMRSTADAATAEERDGPGVGEGVSGGMTR